MLSYLPVLVGVACAPILSVSFEGMGCEPVLNLVATPDEAVSIARYPFQCAYKYAPVQGYLM